MATVAINPPKTPVTKGSQSIAAATVPNVCKMPGPPAPFVPTPLPNIGRSALSPQDYSTTVKIEGNEVAIRGSSFGSIGDIASKPTGGGIVSMNTQGQTKFIGPGSMDVKIEGKNVQYLADPMMNNCGPSGSPANAATLGGVLHVPGGVPPKLSDIAKQCHAKVEREVAKGRTDSKGNAPSCATKGTWKHKCCQDKLEKKGFTNVACESPAGTTDCRLDVVIFHPPGPPAIGNVTHIFDYKFPCTRPPKISRRQAGKYKRFAAVLTMVTR
jgi:hypothetical protein